MAFNTYTHSKKVPSVSSKGLSTIVYSSVIRIHRVKICNENLCVTAPIWYNHLIILLSIGWNQ